MGAHFFYTFKTKQPMTVYAFTKTLQGSSEFAGPAKQFFKNFDPRMCKTAVFVASIESSNDIPLVNTLISNIYVDPWIVVQARKCLETLHSQFISRPTSTSLTSFNIWFSFPPPPLQHSRNLLNESVYNSELLLSDLEMSDSDIELLVADMAQKGFPIIVHKLDSQPHDYEAYRQKIHLSFYPS